MKAITFNPSTDIFKLTSIECPIPQQNEVRIKVEACAINPVDAKIRFWKNRIDNMPADWVVGLDVCGTIDAIGENTTEWKVGDRVFYHGNMLKKYGGLAEFAIQDTSNLLATPETTSSIDIASTPCAGWTAWRALVDKLKVNTNDSLLIIGGSGGVGSFAIQIAKNVLKCPTVIATCSTSNTNYVKQLGADYVIDYTKEDVCQRVWELTQNKGVSKAFDTIGGDNDIVAANSLDFEGELLELTATIRAEKYNLSFLKGLTFHQLSLGAGYGYGDKGRATIIDAGKKFTDEFIKGNIQLPKLRTVSLEDTINELNKILDKKTVGKVVMKIQ